MGIGMFQGFGAIGFFSLFHGDASPTPGHLEKRRDNGQDGHYPLGAAREDARLISATDGERLLSDALSETPQKIPFLPSLLLYSPPRRGGRTSWTFLIFKSPSFP